MITGLTGEYSHALDSAGRVALPARFRDAFKEEVVLARLFEPCVSVFTPDGWESVRGRLNGLDVFQADARTMQRLLLSRVFTAEPDRQGRVLIPPRLREQTSLEQGQPVTVLGVDDRLELWNPELWAQEQARWETNLSEIAERLRG